MSNRFGGISRRDFLKYTPVGIAALLGTASGAKHLLTGKPRPLFPGKIAGANAEIGHMMRMRKFPAVSTEKRIETVIVGGGISGLSAAWWLDREGYKDFLLLELDNNMGGNSQSGSNGVGAYPWGAHYLPLPGAEAVYVREFLEEIGVIKGYKNGIPEYDEFYLCADPGERLFFQGRWHAGVLPQSGVQENEKSQYDEFFSLMKEYGAKKGNDGRKAFTVPLDLSSQDENLLQLDKISMAQFMKEKGWNSRHLKWYVDYCCKDDYGQTSENVSAWAGIHYFASRSGRAVNADRETVLTWPEGNGWLVKKMEEKLKPRLSQRSLVFNIEKDFVDYYDTVTKTSHRIFTKNVIYAAPRYTAKYSINSSMGELVQSKAVFAPWMTANVTVNQRPEGHGHELAWDNVSFYSPSLGYIVSTHQDLSHSKTETVLTYYLPLTDDEPNTARIKAYTKKYDYWAKFAADDLEKMHPGISKTITNIDVWVWGHGMAGPGIGYLWGENRKEMKKSMGHIHFAHSELSGISIFEEAQYHGVMAAKKVLGSKA